MPPPPPPPLPELSDDLLGEAFLRLPPDDPACLLRASLACKRWRRILADPAFHRRHRELHRTPSVVGFLCPAGGDGYASRFVPTNPASGHLAARDLPGRSVLDCRHGRVLFLAPSPSLGFELNYDLVVWDPLTNEQRCLPRPSPPLTYPLVRHFNAAVLCSATAEGCDHSKCHGGPFLVAFVWSRRTGCLFPGVTSARLYSSETGNWSEPVSAPHPEMFIDMPRSSTLVGDNLYFTCGDKYALEYRLGAQRLSVIECPPLAVYRNWKVFFVSMGDGGLGCVHVEGNKSSVRLQLWSREAASNCDGVERWTRGRAIGVEKLLLDDAFPSPRFPRIQLLGFAEGTDVIFVGTQSWSPNDPDAVYMVQLNSGRTRKVFDRCIIVIPYTSFCIPVTDASSTTEGPGDNASGSR